MHDLKEQPFCRGVRNRGRSHNAPQPPENVYNALFYFINKKLWRSGSPSRTLGVRVRLVILDTAAVNEFQSDGQGLT